MPSPALVPGFSFELETYASDSAICGCIDLGLGFRERASASLPREPYGLDCLAAVDQLIELCAELGVVHVFARAMAHKEPRFDASVLAEYTLGRRRTRPNEIVLAAKCEADDSVFYPSHWVVADTSSHATVLVTRVAQALEQRHPNLVTQFLSHNDFQLPLRPSAFPVARLFAHRLINPLDMLDLVPTQQQYLRHASSRTAPRPRMESHCEPLGRDPEEPVVTAEAP